MLRHPTIQMMIRVVEGALWGTRRWETEL